MIWSTEDKPNFSEEDENACQVQLVDEINLFFKDMIHSFFFPNGFVVKEWNLVLVTIKDEFATQVRHSNDGLIRGWLMGTDFESQMMIGSKILVKMP